MGSGMAAMPMMSMEPYGGRGPLVLGVTWALAAIATSLMALRLYVKFGMKRPGGSALNWAIAAYGMNILTQIFATIGIRQYGIGNHVKIVQESGVLRETLIFIWISSSVALLAIGLGKVAACFLVLDIIGPTKKGARIALRIIAAINMIGLTIVAIAVWFQCHPEHKLWDVEVPGNCSSQLAIQYLSMIVSSISGASDFVIALFPAVIIWQLAIETRLKLGLSILMGLGTFTGVCAVIKVTTLPTISNSTDPTYEISKLLLWGFTESWVVLIVTLIPPTFPIRHAFSNLKKPSTYGSTRGRSGHIQLSGAEQLGPGLRGDYKSAYKSRGYVDHSVVIPSDNSMVDLPSNAITMKQDIQVKTEYATMRVDEKSASRSVSHTPSRRSASDSDDIEMEKPYNRGGD